VHGGLSSCPDPGVTKLYSWPAKSLREWRARAEQNNYSSLLCSLICSKQLNTPKTKTTIIQLKVLGFPQALRNLPTGFRFHNIAVFRTCTNLCSSNYYSIRELYMATWSRRLKSLFQTAWENTEVSACRMRPLGGSDGLWNLLLICIWQLLAEIDNWLSVIMFYGRRKRRDRGYQPEVYRG